MHLESPAALATSHPLDFMAQTTPQVRDTVGKLQMTLPSDEFAQLLASVRSAFEKYTAKLRQFNPGSDRGMALHQMMDREMSAVARLPVSCGKGCSGCCHYEVEVTQNEAAVLKGLVLGGLAINHERLQLQAARARRSPEWLRFGSPDNRCVFLGEDGACQVYDDRPSICRKHMVTTPASACTTEGAAVAPVQVLLAEILLSAELSVEGNEFGSLSKMLLRSLDDSSTRRHGKSSSPPSGAVRAGAVVRAGD
ncbi:MAG: YkgJ family cysteine cluster protein [Undibacterium sp.]|nr:YkgJ family cysteine cluster protein [Opitutaceae bacterium]